MPCPRTSIAETALGLVCARQGSASLFCRGLCVSTSVKSSALQHCKSKSLALVIRPSRLVGQTLWATRYGSSNLVETLQCAAADFEMLCKDALPAMMKLCRPSAVVCLLGVDLECRRWSEVNVEHMIIPEDVVSTWDRSGIVPAPRLEWEDARTFEWFVWASSEWCAKHPPKLTLRSKDYSLQALCAAPTWLTDCGMLDRATFTLEDGQRDAKAWEAWSVRRRMRSLSVTISDPDMSSADLACIFAASPALTDLRIVVDVDEDTDAGSMAVAAAALETVRIPGLKRLAWDVNVDHTDQFQPAWAYSMPDWAIDQIEVLRLDGNGLINDAFTQAVASCRRLHTLEVHPGFLDCYENKWVDLLQEVAIGPAGKSIEVLVIGSSGGIDGGCVLDGLLDWWEEDAAAFPALKHLVVQDAMDAWRDAHGDIQDELDRRLYEFLRKNRAKGIRLNKWSG